MPNGKGKFPWWTAKYPWWEYYPWELGKYARQELPPSKPWLQPQFATGFRPPPEETMPRPEPKVSRGYVSGRVTGVSPEAGAVTRAWQPPPRQLLTDVKFGTEDYYMRSLGFRPAPTTGAGVSVGDTTATEQDIVVVIPGVLWQDKSTGRYIDADSGQPIDPRTAGFLLRQFYGGQGPFEESELLRQRGWLSPAIEIEASRLERRGPMGELLEGRKQPTAVQAFPTQPVVGESGMQWEYRPGDEWRRGGWVKTSGQALGAPGMQVGSGISGELQKKQAEVEAWEWQRRRELSGAQGPYNWIRRWFLEHEVNPYAEEYEQMTEGDLPVSHRPADVLETPKWLTPFTGQRAGEQLQKRSISAPSFQSLARLNPTEIQKLAGYTKWSGQEWEDLIAQTKKMVPTGAGHAAPRWRVPTRRV